MNDWGPLGGNPCPGDAGVIRTFAGRLAAVSAQAHDVELRLGGIAAGLGGLRWTGEGAQGVHEAMTTTIPDIVEVASSHRDSSSALRAWAEELADLQRRGSALLQQYWDAVARRDAAAGQEREAGRLAGAYATHRADVTLRLRLAQTHLLAARTAQQPTAALEAQVHDLERRKATLGRQHDAAAADAATAARDRQRAEDERGRVLGLVRALRHEHEDSRKRASGVILLAAGGMPDGNVLVTAWNGLASFQHTVVTSDVFAAFIDATEQVGTWVSIAAVVAGFIPGLQPLAAALATAGLVLSGVTALGRVLQAANGTQSWETAGGALLAFGLAGFGRAMRVAAGGKEADSSLGVLKRVIWYDDARKATGIFSPKGLTVADHVVTRVHAAPKLIGIAAPHARAYYSFSLFLDGVELADKVHDAVDKPGLRSGYELTETIIDIIGPPAVPEPGPILQGAGR